MSKDDELFGGAFSTRRGIGKETREAEREHPRQPSQGFMERPAPAPEEAPPTLLFPADRAYAAYETRSRPESLMFLTAVIPAGGAAYHQLQNYLFDQHHGQFLTLFYPPMRVHITGQRLAPVIHAVLSYKCAIIREWHKDFYDPPARGIPVIEAIAITPMGREYESA
ncbi:MAG: hypothetical protein JOZ32_19095 [Bryobacterales bacterium]|nr:hypothetical protein [Bryobacterales bacterium]